MVSEVPYRFVSVIPSLPPPLPSSSCTIVLCGLLFLPLESYTLQRCLLFKPAEASLPSMTLGVEFRVPALAEALYHPAWAGLLFQPTSLCPISCLPLSRPRDLFAIPWIRPATLSFNLCLCGSFYQDGVPQIAPWPPSSLLSGVCSPPGRHPPLPHHAATQSSPLLSSRLAIFSFTGCVLHIWFFCFTQLQEGQAFPVLSPLHLWSPELFPAHNCRPCVYI